MRFPGLLLLLFTLLAPLAGHAAEECPVNYIKNSMGLCERKKCASNTARIRCQPGQAINEAVCPVRCSPRCPEGFYYDTRVKLCAPYCANGGTMGIGDSGGVVCKMPRALTEAEKFASRCTRMGRVYVPQTGVCGGAAKDKTSADIDPNQCPKGQLAVKLGGTYSCKKGKPEDVMKSIQDKLEKTGLSYVEYLKMVAKAQTNILDLKVVESRIAEVERGIEFDKQNKDAPKTDEAPKAGACPAGYVPNNDGKGCKPEQDCSMYRCPGGRVPELQKSGDTYYCGC